MKVAANLTALRALAPDGENYAKLLGYASPGDAGSGDWYYDAADTTTPDNVGMVVTSGSTGRWKRFYDGMEVSAAWFGALGIQGSSGASAPDSTATLQAAINYVVAMDKKATLRIPLGQYRITDQLLVGDSASGVLIRGAGGHYGERTNHTTIDADFAPISSGAAATIGTWSQGSTGSGLTSEITSFSTITGLTGLSVGMEGAVVYFPAATNAQNVGAWTIVQVLSATSCIVEASGAELRLTPESGLTWYVVNKAAILTRGYECGITGIVIRPGVNRVLWAGFSSTTGTITGPSALRWTNCRVSDDYDPLRHVIHGFVHADHPTQPGLGPWVVGSSYKGYGNGDRIVYESCSVKGAMRCSFWTPSPSGQNYQMLYDKCDMRQYNGRAGNIFGWYGIVQNSGTAQIRDCAIQSTRGPAVLQMASQISMIDCLTEFCARVVSSNVNLFYRGPKQVMILGGRYSIVPGVDIPATGTDKKIIRMETAGPLVLIGAQFDPTPDTRLTCYYDPGGGARAGHGVFIGNSFPNTNVISDPPGAYAAVHTLLGNVGWLDDAGGVEYIADQVSSLKGAALLQQTYPASIKFGRASSSGAQWVPTLGVISGTTYTDSDGGTTTQFDAAVDQPLTGSVYLPSAPTDGQVVRVRDVYRSQVRRSFTLDGSGKLIDGLATVLLPNVGTHWLRYSTATGQWTRTVRY